MKEKIGVLRLALISIEAMASMELKEKMFF